MFPWGSVVGLVAILAGGFIWYKLLFPSSGPQSAEEEDLCPYCGQKLMQSELDSKQSPETPGLPEGLRK